MKTTLGIFAVVCVIVVQASFAANAPYEITSDSVYQHIAVLASDSLEGREIGEPGEWKAAVYIAKVLQEAGLQPWGNNETYFQDFEFIKRIDFTPNNSLIVNGQPLQLHEEFVPMRQSASAKFDFREIVRVDYGIKVPEDEGTYDDYAGKEVEGKAVLIKRYSPSADDNPHIDFGKYESLTDKIQTAIEHNVAGIFIITPENQDDTLATVGPSYIHMKEVPIVFIRRKGLERLGLNLARPEITSIQGETELTKTRDSGYNVVASLPAANDTTVIIGAHYDHLGWGSTGSRYMGEEKLVHNGADDNASGVAALLELARYYADRRDELKYSLIFVAFSGEESGILGSNTFAKGTTVDSGKVRMMLNMDMIGRLKDQENGLAIFGTGTCAEFKSFFDSLTTDSVKLTLKESGTGPSDHTPFYNRKIPVLHFFTGAHDDYHKPSDDVDKIDTKGIVRVADIVSEVVDYFDKYPGQLTFQKTKDSSEGKRRSQFSVTLGIMPDYIAEVRGLKVDGVSPDRPGDKAGLREGDVIIKMGDIIVNDIYDYMSALGKFRKGDSIVVDVERGTDTLNLDVVFQ